MTRHRAMNTSSNHHRELERTPLPGPLPFRRGEGDGGGVEGLLPKCKNGEKGPEVGTSGMPDFEQNSSSNVAATEEPNLGLAGRAPPFGQHALKIRPRATDH